MSRPLIVTDCDEVLLHMVGPFRDWLAEAHDIAFDMAGGDFARSMKRIGCDEPIEMAEIWTHLGGFFDTEMHRQFPIAGSVEGIAALREHADVVVLTNLQEHRREDRRRQLTAHGIDVPVYTNQGPKGPALRAILEEYRPSRAVFIDDLAQHHGSAAETTPHVTRLHLCGEPLLAPHIACAEKAGHAHARIDDWATALPWLIERLHADNDT